MSMVIAYCVICDEYEVTHVSFHPDQGGSGQIAIDVHVDDMVEADQLDPEYRLAWMTRLLDHCRQMEEDAQGVQRLL